MHLSNATTRRRTLVNKPPRTVVFSLTKCVTNSFETGSSPGRHWMSRRVKARRRLAGTRCPPISLGVPLLQDVARATGGVADMMIGRSGIGDQPARPSMRRYMRAGSLPNPTPEGVVRDTPHRNLFDFSVLARGRTPGVAVGCRRSAVARFSSSREVAGVRRQTIGCVGRQCPVICAKGGNDASPGHRRGSSQPFSNLILNPTQNFCPIPADSD